MSKTVLHELLAVETSLGETANRITKETTKTLGEKQSIFTGMTKENEIFAEEDQFKKATTEFKEITTTVGEQLNFLGENVANYYDVLIQKEDANQRAKADIIIDGTTIAANVPSIMLLGLEKKLTSLLGTYNAIPTLDAAKSWIPATDNLKPDAFKQQHPEVRQQTETKKEYITISPATERHQAQITTQDKVTIVGSWTTVNFSGAITSVDKANKLRRLTKLIRAVKSARQRANTVEVNTELSIGSAFFAYVNN